MIDVLVLHGDGAVSPVLRPFLLADNGFQVVAETGDAEAAVRFADRRRPDVVLLNEFSSFIDEATLIGRLRAYAGVLVISQDSSTFALTEALTKGALGYLVTGDFAKLALRDAVTAVSQGRGWLSPLAAAAAVSALAQGNRHRIRPSLASSSREVFVTQREAEILELVCLGLPNASIGRRLGVSEKTVKNHLHNAFLKLDAGNRTEAARVWQTRRNRT